MIEEMTPPIKCKAWDETNREWITYGFCLRFDADGNCEVLNAFAQPFTDRKVTPVFWTGYKDKNGVEIYASDIIHIEDDEVPRVVTWGEFEDCCVEGEAWLVYPNSWQPTLYYYLDRCEVVGNINENSEFING